MKNAMPFEQFNMFFGLLTGTNATRDEYDQYLKQREKLKDTFEKQKENTQSLKRCSMKWLNILRNVSKPSSKGNQSCISITTS